MELRQPRSAAETIICSIPAIALAAFAVLNAGAQSQVLAPQVQGDAKIAELIAEMTHGRRGQR